MKRREFVRLLSVGSVTLGNLSHPAAAKEAAKGLGKPEGGTAERVSSSKNYYEFSTNGMECIIKRPDTPVPWMNLLSNDLFQTWITQRGNIECAMLDRSLNRLTNPQETSGYVYLPDRRTGQYFSVNRPKADAAWQCRQGLGYTSITTSAMGLVVDVTHFVPRCGYD